MKSIVCMTKEQKNIRVVTEYYKENKRLLFLFQFEWLATLITHTYHIYIYILLQMVTIVNNSIWDSIYLLFDFMNNRLFCGNDHFLRHNELMSTSINRLFTAWMTINHLNSKDNMLWSSHPNVMIFYRVTILIGNTFVVSTLQNFIVKCS